MSGRVLNEEYFEELFERHFKSLTAFAHSFVRDEGAAKDIVHDVFVVLWNGRGKLDSSRPLKPYLYTLTQNFSLNYLKHLRVVEANHDRVADVLFAEQPEQGEYDERYRRVKTRLDSLTAGQRDAFIKCVVDGKTYREAAEELNVSVNTVKTQISRAYAAIRSKL